MAAIACMTVLALAPASLAQSPAPGYVPSVGDPADIAALYALQSEFHAAASVHDPVNGDSPAVIEGRLRDMMALFTKDATLDLMVGGKNDGAYTGTGDPSDPATCGPVTGDAGGQRGTLCTLFKYVAGSFQPQNRFVSLAPSYLTHFVVEGDHASVYFQCHYFDVSKDPWAVASHLVFDGSAVKQDGQWLFDHVSAPVAKDVPVPGQTPAPLASPMATAVIANC
jgi:hypothetical protein